MANETATLPPRTTPTPDQAPTASAEAPLSHFNRAEKATHAESLTTYYAGIVRGPGFKTRLKEAVDRDPNDLFNQNGPVLRNGDEVWQVPIGNNERGIKMKLMTSGGEKVEELQVKNNPDAPGNPDSSIVFRLEEQLETTRGTLITINPNPFEDDPAALREAQKLLTRFNAFVNPTPEPTPASSPPPAPTPSQ